MTKWILVLLLLANVILFSVMQWGRELTVDAEIPSVQTEFNPQMIQLLSGVPSAVAPAEPVVVTTAVGSAVTEIQPASILSQELKVVPKQHKQCAAWGEFSGKGLAQVQAELAALVPAESLMQTTVEHTSGYWVYIPPLKKKAEVQNKIEQLKKLGVEDYFVVLENGAWFNAISLGVFRTEKSAQRYLESLKVKGVRTAQVGERKSKLKFTQFSLKNLDAASADKIRLLQKEFPDSELKIENCN